MRARVFVLLLAVLSLAGCAVWRAPEMPTIALVAPFEGQFREIGYEALYAVRLGIADANAEVRLLAIDDGGTDELAAARIEALRNDASIAGVIALGVHASSEPAQEELNELPMIIAGYWDTEPLANSTVILANSTLAEETLTFENIMADKDADVGSDIFGLSVMPALINNDELTILSSGQLATDTFRERYLASDMFVPEPRHIATLVYDATGVLLTALQEDIPLSTVTYAGLSGEIMFRDGYWQDAPVYRYRFGNDGTLVLSDD
ncbi:MAG: hypothetical protein AAFV98_11555 [Chloroflexota bacterium]